jgi:hypothetical protein
VSGTAAGVVSARALNAAPDSYAVAGADAGLEYAQPEVWDQVVRANKAHNPTRFKQVSQTFFALEPQVAGSYELDAQPGSFAVTGVDAGLEAALVWDKVVSPNYAFTTPQIFYGSRIFYGVESAAAAYEIDAQPGSFAVTGSAAGLVAARVVAATAGSYALTGSDAGLVYGVIYLLDAQPASFTVNGVAAGLVAARVLSATPATFAVTGSQAGLVADRVLSGDPGSYTVTGSQAGLVASRVLSGDPGSYVVTGALAGLIPPGGEAGVTHSRTLTGFGR